jgi:DNA polymerase V
MINAGILSGDVLVVDRSVDPNQYNNQIVVAELNGEFTVKRLQFSKGGSPRLLAENDLYLPILITEEMDFKVWGVVVGVARRL